MTDALAPRVPYVLAIDTATAWGGVALFEGHVPLAELSFLRRRGQVQRLALDVELVLKTHGLTPAELGLIAVCVGPGAFTGIRLGMATARAFGWAVGVPVVGTCSLAALAWGAHGEGAVVATVLDARKAQVYGALYELTAPDVPPVALIEPCVMFPSDFRAVVEHHPRAGSAVWVGDGLTAYAPAFAGVRAAKSPLAHRPMAAYTGLLGLAGFAAGRCSRWEAIEPVYLRASEAEENMGPPTGAVLIESL